MIRVIGYVVFYWGYNAEEPRGGFYLGLLPLQFNLYILGAANLI